MRKLSGAGKPTVAILRNGQRSAATIPKDLADALVTARVLRKLHPITWNGVRRALGYNNIPAFYPAVYRAPIMAWVGRVQTMLERRHPSATHVTFVRCGSQMDIKTIARVLKKKGKARG